MKIIKPGLDLDTWITKTKCEICESEITITATDVLTAKFKVSGYHFDGSAVSEQCWYVDCPACDAYIFLTDLPVLVQRQAKDQDQ